jgi:hypothetical protein
VYGNVVAHNLLTYNGTLPKSPGAGVVVATEVPHETVAYDTVIGNTIYGNGIAGVTIHGHLPGLHMAGNERSWTTTSAATTRSATRSAWPRPLPTTRTGGPRASWSGV